MRHSYPQAKCWSASQKLFHAPPTQCSYCSRESRRSPISSSANSRPVSPVWTSTRSSINVTVIAAVTMLKQSPGAHVFSTVPSVAEQVLGSTGNDALRPTNILRVPILGQPFHEPTLEPIPIVSVLQVAVPLGIRINVKTAVSTRV